MHQRRHWGLAVRASRGLGLGTRARSLRDRQGVTGLQRIHLGLRKHLRQTENTSDKLKFKPLERNECAGVFV